MAAPLPSFSRLLPRLLPTPGLHSFTAPIRHPPCLPRPSLYLSRRHFSASIFHSKEPRSNGNPSPAEEDAASSGDFEKKRSPRSQSSKSSLRRAAAASDRRSLPAQPGTTKLCTAYCTAEKYNLRQAARILHAHDYKVDPFNTRLTDHVVHLRLSRAAEANGNGQGDVFVFPSGNIVAWNLPSAQVSSLAKLIRPAAESPFEKEVETEDLEYVEDPRIRRSRIAGDVIILGTAVYSNYVVGEPLTDSFNELTAASSSTDIAPVSPSLTAADELNVVLAKIAFSSGLARSTKLAVLESLLNDYLVTTSSIPTLLSRGSRLPFTRPFILRKTGELLQFRAQLNLYSELTDSLPDLFWDSRHELGLEGYYESVGRALDVDVRIRQLNAKLDYASGIVSVLRERLSEKHSLRLEWIIIILITVEVGFEINRMVREGRHEEREERRYRRWRERKERDADTEYQTWLRDQDAREEEQEEETKRQMEKRM